LETTCPESLSSWEPPGFSGDVDDRDAAFDFVDGGNDGGFGDFGDREAGGFDFLGARRWPRTLMTSSTRPRMR